LSKTAIEEKIEQWKQVRESPELLYSNVYCLFGFIKLLESYYCILVTGVSKVASLHGHWIYTITDVKYLPVTYKMSLTPEEVKYRTVMQGLNLTKHFYFCYSYDLTSTLQKNCTQVPDELGVAQAVDMFAWNTFAVKPLLDLLTAHLEDISNDTGRESVESIDSEDIRRTLSTVEAMRAGNSNRKGVLLKGSQSTSRPVHDMVMDWIVPIIHGYVDERLFKLCNGPDLRFVLIARRSRKFAGTRYLRRGINSSGDAANEVETEQIYTRERLGGTHPYRSSSVVILRGSIPLFWSHTNLYSPKPDVVLEPMEETKEASRRLFGSIYKRYGNHVTCISLLRMKKNKAEIPLGEAFRTLCNELASTTSPVASHAAVSTVPFQDSHRKSIDGYPQSLSEEPDGGLLLDEKSCPVAGTLPLDYIAYDFLHGLDQYGTIDKIGKEVFTKSGFFVQPSIGRHRSVSYEDTFSRTWSTQLAEIITGAGAQGSGAYRVRETRSSGRGVNDGMLQRGVVRVNCVDCLDRTNVAQFTYAKLVAGMQIKALGIELSDENLKDLLMEGMACWAEHGDTMAMQYAGSAAMHKVGASDDKSGGGERVFVLAAGKRNALVAAQRYYSNVSTDFDRQHSMDLILGIIEPELGTLPTTVRPEEIRLGMKGRRASDVIINIDWQSMRSPGTHVKLEEDDRQATADIKSTEVVNPLTRALRAYTVKFPIRFLDTKCGLHFHSSQVRHPSSITSFESFMHESYANMPPLPWKVFPTQHVGPDMDSLMRQRRSSAASTQMDALSPAAKIYKEYVNLATILPDEMGYVRGSPQEIEPEFVRCGQEGIAGDEGFVAVYNIPGHIEDADLVKEPVWSHLRGIQQLCGHKTALDVSEYGQEDEEDEMGSFRAENLSEIGVEIPPEVLMQVRKYSILSNASSSPVRVDSRPASITRFNSAYMSAIDEVSALPDPPGEDEKKKGGFFGGMFRSASKRA